jgi:Flp pilus assembly CpaF family ATPase
MLIADSNHERIITIELIAELDLQQAHGVSLEARPANSSPCAL